MLIAAKSVCKVLKIHGILGIQSVFQWLYQVENSEYSLKNYFAD
jgi:hypothetical protein